MRPELVFFNSFSLLGTQNQVIFGKKFKFDLLIYRKYLNLKKNHAKSEQISRVHTKFQSSITPRKKTRIEKNLFNFEFYAGPAFQ